MGSFKVGHNYRPLAGCPGSFNEDRRLASPSFHSYTGKLGPQKDQINIRILLRCMSYSIWYTNIRILLIMVSGIPLILGLGTKMSDPHVSVLFWAPQSIQMKDVYPRICGNFRRPPKTEHPVSTITDLVPNRIETRGTDEPGITKLLAWGSSWNWSTTPEPNTNHLEAQYKPKSTPQNVCNTGVGSIPLKVPATTKGYCGFCRALVCPYEGPK